MTARSEALKKAQADWPKHKANERGINIVPAGQVEVGWPIPEDCTCALLWTRDPSYHPKHPCNGQGIYVKFVSKNCPHHSKVATVWTSI